MVYRNRNSLNNDSLYIILLITRLLSKNIKYFTPNIYLKTRHVNICNF